MNCIGIIGAMEVEVALLKEKMENVTIIEKARMKFFKGTLNGKQVVVVRSGIGKVNAAICTQILIDEFKVDAVMNTGIAGSLKAEINIGDVVISTDAVHHDMDAVGFGYAPGQIPQMEEFSFAADEEMAELAAKVCKEVNPDIAVFRGRVASGDQFVTSHEVKDRIKAQFDAYCVEMEGVAIGQTAYLNHVPFVIIRAISDKADDSASMDYEVFEKKAVEHSVKLTENFIKEL